MFLIYLITTSQPHPIKCLISLIIKISKQPPGSLLSMDNDFSRVLIVIIKIASIVGEEAQISTCELCEIYWR